MGREYDAQGVGVVLADLLQKLHPRGAGHLQVENGQVEVAGSQHPARLGTVRSGFDDIAGFFATPLAALRG